VKTEPPVPFARPVCGGWEVALAGSGVNEPGDSPLYQSESVALGWAEGFIEGWRVASTDPEVQAASSRELLEELNKLNAEEMAARVAQLLAN
jgi:hypothetical protein